MKNMLLKLLLIYGVVSLNANPNDYDKISREMNNESDLDSDYDGLSDSGDTDNLSETSEDLDQISEDNKKEVKTPEEITIEKEKERKQKEEEREQKEEKINQEVIPMLLDDFLKSLSYIFTDQFLINIYNTINHDNSYCNALLQRVKTNLINLRAELRDKNNTFKLSLNLIKGIEKGTKGSINEQAKIHLQSKDSENIRFKKEKETIKQQKRSRHAVYQSKMSDQINRIKEIKSKNGAYLKAMDEQEFKINNFICISEKKIEIYTKNYVKAKKNYDNALGKLEGLKNANDNSDKHNKIRKKEQEVRDLEDIFKKSEAKYNTIPSTYTKIEQSKNSLIDLLSKKEKELAIYEDNLQKTEKDVAIKQDELTKHYTKDAAKLKEEEKKAVDNHNKKIIHLNELISGKKEQKKDVTNDSNSAKGNLSYKEIVSLESQIKSLRMAKRDLKLKAKSEKYISSIIMDIIKYRNDSFADAMMSYIHNPKIGTREKAASALHNLISKMYSFANNLKSLGLADNDSCERLKNNIKIYKHYYYKLLSYNDLTWSERFNYRFRAFSRFLGANERPKNIENYEKLKAIENKDINFDDIFSGIAFEIRNGISILQTENIQSIPLDEPVTSSMEINTTLEEKIKKALENAEIFNEKQLKEANETLEKVKEKREKSLAESKQRRESLKSNLDHINAEKCQTNGTKVGAKTPKVESFLSNKSFCDLNAQSMFDKNYIVNKTSFKDYIGYGIFGECDFDIAKINDSFILSVGGILRYDNSLSTYFSPLICLKHKSGYGVNLNIFGIITEFNFEMKFLTPYYCGCSLSYNKNLGFGVRIFGNYVYSDKFNKIDGYLIPFNVRVGILSGVRK